MTIIVIIMLIIVIITSLCTHINTGGNWKVVPNCKVVLFEKFMLVTYTRPSNMKIDMYGCVSRQAICQHALQYTLIKIIVFCACTKHIDNNNKINIHQYLKYRKSLNTKVVSSLDDNKRSNILK